MSTPKLSRPTAEAAVAALNECLRDGFSNRGHPSAIQEAARRLEIDQGTLRNRVRCAKTYYGLEPTVVENVLVAHKARKETTDWRAERKNLLERLTQAEDIRSGVLGLMHSPPEPKRFDPPTSAKGERLAETIILPLFDWHWDERVDLGMMDGVNSYNRKIAQARAKRFFTTVFDLATDHWTGPRPARVIVIIGGDMISGENHSELRETNDGTALDSVKDCASAIMGGTDLLLKLGCPVDFIVLPGNHGRVRASERPQAKINAQASFDTLLGDFLELHYRAHPKVSFYSPQSGEACFSVAGWSFVTLHGDRIGTSGGQGGAGAAAPTARGMRKIFSDYAGRGLFVDYSIMGHYHQSMRLEDGFVSGCLVGPNEYPRDRIRPRPRPACQWFLTCHPRWGISQMREIFVGDPGEGSIYAPRKTSDPGTRRFDLPRFGKGEK